jgi:hypothetical protein
VELNIKIGDREGICELDSSGLGWREIGMGGGVLNTVRNLQVPKYFPNFLISTFLLNISKFHQNTRGHILDDNIVHNHCRGSLMFRYGYLVHYLSYGLSGMA